MTKIDLDLIEMTTEERVIAERILVKGVLRASKPTIRYTKVWRNVKIGDVEFRRELREPDEIEGKAAYVWRMVAFNVSPNPRHHCMPTTADFDLPAREHDERRAMAKEMDGLVNRIVNSVPKSEWHGIRRWSLALNGR